jgi:spore photoproduct lyase
MVPYRPQEILVQEQSWQDSVTREIIQNLPGVPVSTIENIDARTLDPENISHPRLRSRDSLVLMRYPGRFLKRCQGAGAEICCNYYTVSYGWNCHFGCTYCILQTYFGHEAMVICTNVEEMISEIKETLEHFPDRKFRIGTGELADSLALDLITGFSSRLVPFFASLSNGFLELKTKSDQISNLEDLDHRGHTVISWSMNSKHICCTEEPGAPDLEARLAAAVKCQRWGYKVGIHFDPLVYYEGWETGYMEAVKIISRAIDPGKLAWVSLGGLRFPPHLRELVQKVFPDSRIPYGEFVPGHHGKLRYFRPIREEMYRKMHSWIQEALPQALIYLCMESRAVWENSFGYSPLNTLQLGAQLDKAAGI